jgi:hypothetical protein
LMNACILDVAGAAAALDNGADMLVRFGREVLGWKE